MLFIKRIREADDPALVPCVWVTCLWVNLGLHRLVHEKLSLVEVTEL